MCIRDSHRTKAISQREKNIQLLHIFDVSLLAGEQGSRIEQKYIAPVITAPQIEVIPLFLGNAEEERILKLLAASFRLSSDEFGYEIKLREALTEIWLMLFELSRSMREKKGERNKSNDKIKLLMIYIHEHYREKISIPELAAAAYLSERECYRLSLIHISHPEAKLLVHPECLPEVSAMADYIGSTTGIMKYAKESNAKEFIIGTENSIVQHLQYECPDKKFYPLSKDCVCHNMKLTTLMDVYNCVCGQGGEEIKLDENVRVKAKACIDTMLTMGE